MNTGGELKLSIKSLQIEPPGILKIPGYKYFFWQLLRLTKVVWGYQD